jgi:hypothetical protein
MGRRLEDSGASENKEVRRMSEHEKEEIGLTAHEENA